MFTTRSISLGTVAVLVLFIAMYLFRTFNRVVGHKASGPGVLVADLSTVLTSPAFWLSAVLIFFVICLLVGRSHVVSHS
jgi:hypothetical protein